MDKENKNRKENFGQRVGGKEVCDKRFKWYLDWLVLGLFIVLILGASGSMTVGQEIGVYLNGSNSSYTLEEDLNIINNTGANTFGIFVDNDTSNIFSDLTINATLEVTQTNSTAGNKTIGIFANGAIEEGSQVRPIGNLTITENGTIQVLAGGVGGSYVYAAGVDTGSIGDLTNSGSITVSASGGSYARAYGVDADNIVDLTNSGSITVSASGTDNASAYGVYAGSIGNLTNNGTIQVLANGTEVLAGGVVVGNVTNLINEGRIDVFGNVTDSSGQLMLAGVYALNATNFVNSGNINVNGTGGYVNYADNNIPVGVEIESVGNFTNTGNILVSIESINATAVGVKSEDIGYFNNTGNISVFTNSTGGEWSAVVGVMAGLPEEIEGGESGEIGIFINDGNLTVSGYADGGELNAVGVAVFNGTIGEFRNLEGGKIEVYGENNGGSANVIGVMAGGEEDYIGQIGNFTNEGSIIVTAKGVDEVTAFGVSTTEDIGNFTNTGLITVSAISTNGTTEAAGVDTGSIGDLTNSGSIIGSANGTDYAEAYGVVADNIGDLTNSGSITGSANGTNADAYGVYTGSIVNLTNSGSITGSASGTSLVRTYGVYAGSIGNLTNSGSITGSANSEYTAYAYGVYAGYIGKFTSNGSIIVNATATGGNATVYGVYAYDMGNFTNEGTIDVRATATNGTAKAYGLYVDEDTINNFTNNGTIKVIATGKDTEATGVYAVVLTEDLLNESSGTIKVSTIGEQSAKATGLYIEKAQTGSTILNKGIIDISASSSSGTVNSFGIYLKDSEITLINNGTITVSASGNVDKVAGIYIINSTVELSNPGEIVVWGDALSGKKLRTLYVDSGSNVTLKDKFAITFGAPGTGPNTAPIYVESGSSLGLNNATLVVRLWNNSAQYIVVGTPYNLIESNGTVNGNWGELEKGYTNPLIDVAWYDPNITDKDAQIIFKYLALNKPEEALGSVNSMIGGVIVNSIMVDSIFTSLPITSPFILVKGYQPVMLASAGISDVGAGYSLGGVEYRGGMWFKPLYTHVSADDLGFDTNTYGFNIGLGGFLTKNFSLGIYANYLRAEYDYSRRSAKDGDSDIFSLGITGMWIMMKDSYLRYNMYGFSSSNDYNGRTGLNLELKEKASYTMKGVHGEILLGKVYRGKLNVIPEIGIRYTYYNPESFWTKVYDSAGNRVTSWDRYYDPDSKHMWKGVIGVMLASEAKAGAMPVKLYAYGRLEQAFGKNDISAVNYMRSDPTRWKLSREINRTTFIVQLGGEFRLQKNLGLEISGRGDFNGDYTGYSGSMMLRYNW